MAIGYERYVELRDEAKLTDSEVARRAKITRSTFSDWKAGRYYPKWKKLTAIAEVLGCSPQELDVQMSFDVDMVLQIPGGDTDSVFTIESKIEDRETAEQVNRLTYLATALGKKDRETVLGLAELLMSQRDAKITAEDDKSQELADAFVESMKQQKQEEKRGDPDEEP